MITPSPPASTPIATCPTIMSAGGSETAWRWISGVVILAMWIKIGLIELGVIA